MGRILRFCVQKRMALRKVRGDRKHGAESQRLRSMLAVARHPLAVFWQRYQTIPGHQHWRIWFGSSINHLCSSSPVKGRESWRGKGLVTQPQSIRPLLGVERWKGGMGVHPSQGLSLMSCPLNPGNTGSRPCWGPVLQLVLPFPHSSLILPRNYIFVLFAYWVRSSFLTVPVRLRRNDLQEVQ